jgi:BASS family bile acid:Na+ symporter
MIEVLNNVSQWAMLAFLIASMLELGLSLTLSQILAPLKNVRLVGLSLLANFIIVPLLAFGIAKLLRLDQGFAIGLLLLGLAPGAPFIPKVVQLARGNVPFAVGLMVLLMVGTVLDLPLVLPRLMSSVQVDAWQIEKSLFLLMLLPLFVGLVVHARFQKLPGWLRPMLGRVANLAGLVVLVLIVALNLKSVVSVFGTGAIFAGIVFFALSALVGWLAGGSDRATRYALSLGTSLRNVAAALLVGGNSFKDPKVNVMVIVTALVGLVMVVPIASVLGSGKTFRAAVLQVPTTRHNSNRSYTL